LYALDQTDAYRNDPQVKQLIKVFFDPRVQPYLKTTTNPQLKDQLSPVAPPEA
jgi:D-methionine transport system substrate-binding protein